MGLLLSVAGKAGCQFNQSSRMMDGADLQLKTVGAIRRAEAWQSATQRQIQGSKGWLFKCT
jgi:hypothetical protein